MNTDPNSSPDGRPPERSGLVGDREVLAGLVERVTFHNPENGAVKLTDSLSNQRLVHSLSC